MRVVHTVLKTLVLLSSTCLGNQSLQSYQNPSFTSAAEERKHGMEGQGGIVNFSPP